MIVEIYADVVFLINLFMNGAILYIAGSLCRKKAKIWRLILGSAAASVLYTVLIFTPVAPFLNIFTSFVIFAPGVWLVYKAAGLKDFFMTLLAAYIAAFAMGGIAMAMLYIFQGDHIWASHSVGMNNFTIQNLIVAIIVSFVALKLIRRYIIKKHLTKQAFCSFKIHLLDKMAELIALVDTGNSLVDPISQNPVIIAEFDKIKHLLPLPIVRLYAEENQDDLTSLADSFAASGFNTRLRMIPYSAIGKRGVIVGFRPDKIEIIDAGKETKDVIIGICDFALSQDGAYHALMNPQLV